MSAGKPGPSGVLVVDKPRGPTSHDVVARVRRALRTREVGHAGTLDPMATGVLVVAVGEATKLVPWLTADDKGYEATIRLGVQTDTLDAEGIETERSPLGPDVLDALRALEGASVAPRVASSCSPGGPGAPAAFALALPDLVLCALDAERARREQTPPVYSAIKIAGERAHALARRGEAPALAPRPVEVRRLEVVGARVSGASEGEALLDVELDVAKGYFVRALARDLAAGLGTVGHLTRLRRARSGAFTLAEAIPLDVPPEALSAALVPLSDAAARALPRSVLSADGVRAARHGQRVKPGDLLCPHPRASAWLDEAGALVAVGEVDADGTGRVLRGFAASR